MQAVGQHERFELDLQHRRGDGGSGHIGTNRCAPARQSRRARLAARRRALAALRLLVAAPRAARANGAFPESYRGSCCRRQAAARSCWRRTSGSSSPTTAARPGSGPASRPTTSIGATVRRVGPPPPTGFYALSPVAGLAFSDDDSCSWQRGGRRARAGRRTRLLRRPTNPQRVLAVGGAADRRGRSAPPRSSSRPTAARRSARRRSTRRRPARHRRHRDRAQQSAGHLPRRPTRSGPAMHPVLVRSSDGGSSWTPLTSRRRSAPRFPHPGRRPRRRERSSTCG